MTDRQKMDKLTATFKATLKENKMVGVMFVGKENSNDISIVVGGTAYQVGTSIALAAVQALEYFKQFGEEEEFIQAANNLEKAAFALGIYPNSADTAALNRELLRANPCIKE